MCRTREHLERTIQAGGGTSGHSSVEDSIATLDLVKWFVLNKKTKPQSLANFPEPPPSASASGIGSGSASNSGTSLQTSVSGGGRISGIGQVAAMNGFAPGRGVSDGGVPAVLGETQTEAAKPAEKRKRIPLFDDDWI